MRLGALAFLLGILSFQQLVELPNRAWALALLGLLPLFFLLPRWRWLLSYALGLCWALLLTPHLLTLPDTLNATDVLVEGWVASIPQQQARSTRFTFQLTAQAPPQAPSIAGQSLQLSFWHDARAAEHERPQWQVGDRWRLLVRLKKPWGLQNPGGFDYERWLYARGIVATGSIRAEQPPQLLARAERYPLDRYREHIATQFRHALPDNPYVNILIALAIGDQSGITPWQWEVFRRSGISHLMSISGSHISLVAGMAFALFWGLWRSIPKLALYCPAARVAAVVALLAAGAYTLLSGLSIPAQRSFLMVAVGLLAVLALRTSVPSRVLALALWIVLIVDPSAPMSVGFWLSFVAIAAILYTISGRSTEYRTAWLGATIHLQLRISVALIPLSLLFFQEVPGLSPLANLLAIPWMGLTILPFTLLAALLGTLSSTLQAMALHLAAITMEGLWHVLLWLDQSAAATLVHRPAPPLWSLGLGLIGILLWLSPTGVPGRWLGIPLCLPLLFPPSVAPSSGGFWFTLLDVGEGLAALVQTRQHLLVYDTGRRLSDNLDSGQAVLVPFLRQRGATQVDKLIISHADSQHTGGLRSLRQSFVVREIYTAEPQKIAIDGAQACRAGQTWDWDGVRFAILHPPVSGFSGDEASCVLKVTGNAGSLLLPGDIEVGAETALVREYERALAAEILVAPHQGRRKAGSTEFLQAVAPRYVLFATGYHNRYGYPLATTVNQYAATGATLLDSAYQGAVTFRIEAGQPLEPERYRQQQRRYWHTQ